MLSHTLREEQDAEPTGGFAFDVGVIGLGYVGLPTAIAYSTAGSKVLGLDVNQARLRTIRSGGADLLVRDQDRLTRSLESTHLTLDDDPERMSDCAAVIVCVPTPVDDYLTPDLHLLHAACAAVVRQAVAGQTILLTSTTYVGCTHDLLVAPLQARGFVVGRDLFVAFSAERIDPGNTDFEQEFVPRVVGGATPQCEEMAGRLLHRYATNVHRVGSLGAAEMTKLLENTFRAVNIALANEFADICGHLNIDVNDVIDAAATKPYGFMPFRPGPGVGGHCIPCDPHYLLWQLKRQRVSAPLIEQSMVEISQRPGRIVDQVRQSLSERGSALAGARVLVIGIAYKPDVADLRESPALEILSRLEADGAAVGYLDHNFPTVTLQSGSVLTGIVRPDVFCADLILIHTRHSGTDLSWISADQLLLDTRNPAVHRWAAA
ncbi:nucleotide sugar dehydrogenase [Nakamurella silvestris]|nr:nucleotide sugar dehydrogenase [Nakamurella silvestris]